MENKKEPTTNVMDSVLAQLDSISKIASAQVKKPVQLFLFNYAPLLQKQQGGQNAPKD